MQLEYFLCYMDYKGRLAVLPSSYHILVLSTDCIDR